MLFQLENASLSMQDKNLVLCFGIIIFFDGVGAAMGFLQCAGNCIVQIA